MAVDRFSVTMDPELGKAVRAAAEAEGMTVSAWISRAVESRMRLAALDEYLREWQVEHGSFTDDEIAAAEALARDAEREAAEMALAYAAEDTARADRAGSAA